MTEYLDKQSKELVFQMTGERVNDVQHPDYQIAFSFLKKAITFKTKER